MGRPEPVLSRVEGLLSLPPDTDLVEWLLGLEPDERDRAIGLMGPVERESFDRDWGSWAHHGQNFPPKLPDGSDWTTWVVKGGRGFGKTLTGSNWITAAVAGGGPLRIALVGATLDEARRVMVEGKSGLIEVADAWITEWSPSLRRLRFRTGAEAALFSGASPEQLRGPEHHLAWCDELAKWEKPQETWDMLQFGLRLGERPRVLVTTTPRPGPVLRGIMAAPGTIVTGGPSSANPHNSPAWRRDIHARYAGTRLGRQELEGELLTDAPGALWTVELLEKCRKSSPPLDGEGSGVGWTKRPVSALSETPPPPEPSPIKGEGFRRSFTRLVIAVDPPSGDGTCGIIACAKDEAGIAHVLADHSVTARSPEGWSRAVADAASMWGTLSGTVTRDCPHSCPVHVVAEANQGGKMVAAVLRTADPNLRVKLVTATVGKAERAAPVAMLFEAGKVVLHGWFPELEAELLGMIAGGDYEPVWSGGPGGPGVSPDRADAMVWGLTELMLGKERAVPSVRSL